MDRRNLSPADGKPVPKEAPAPGCPFCGGVGEVSTGSNLVPCPKCKGTGKAAGPLTRK
jgi:DnaJ-class molecular chaperone